MDDAKHNALKVKIRKAQLQRDYAEAHRQASDGVTEALADAVDTLIDVVTALLEDVGPSKHAQAVSQDIPTPRMALADRPHEAEHMGSPTSGHPADPRD